MFLFAFLKNFWLFSKMSQSALFNFQELYNFQGLICCDLEERCYTKLFISLVALNFFEVAICAPLKMCNTIINFVFLVERK